MAHTLHTSNAYQRINSFCTFKTTRHINYLSKNECYLTDNHINIKTKKKFENEKDKNIIPKDSRKLSLTLRGSVYFSVFLETILINTLDKIAKKILNPIQILFKPIKHQYYFYIQQ